MRTNGISPKAALAGVVTALGTLATVGVLWLVTGTFDKIELTTALTGLIGALVAFASAYLAPPGDVVKQPVGEASDDLLNPSVVKRLTSHDGYAVIELVFALLLVFVVVFLVTKVSVWFLLLLLFLFLLLA